MEEVIHSYSNYVQVLPHSYGVHMSARRPTAPATECLATECHMDPVPQATECPVVIECTANQNISEMSLSAGWPCFWVLGSCTGCWRAVQ